MSAKPSLPALWATDPLYSSGPTAGAANKVAPPSGRIAQGWEPGDKPTAENLNHRFNLIGEWTLYLSDGDLDGDHSIDGDLDVTDDVGIGGDLHVLGDVTVGGELHYPLEIIPIGPHGWVPLDGDASKLQVAAGLLNLATDGNARISLPVPVGRKITRVEVAVIRDGTSGTVTARLVEVNTAGAASNVAAVSGTTSDNSTLGSFDLDAIYDVEVFAGKWYSLAVTSTGGGAQLVGARITHEATP